MKGGNYHEDNHNSPPWRPRLFFNLHNSPCHSTPLPTNFDSTPTHLSTILGSSRTLCDTAARCHGQNVEHPAKFKYGNADARATADDPSWFNYTSSESQDERSILLTLTPQGTATRLALNDLPDLLTAKGGLNQSEWAQLTQLMTKLMTNLTR